LLLPADSAPPTRLGVGVSATTEGGVGVIAALDECGLLTLFTAADVVVAGDVTTAYTDAAEVFGSQKGADATQIAQRNRRLHDTPSASTARFGVDPGLVGGVETLVVKYLAEPMLARAAAQ